MHRDISPRKVTTTIREYSPIRPTIEREITTAVHEYSPVRPVIDRTITTTSFIDPYPPIPPYYVYPPFFPYYDRYYYPPPQKTLDVKEVKTKKVAKKEQPDIRLYIGTIFKYTYGYTHDFVPRLLVLTGQHIEYYRNESHLKAKKSYTEPIVKVPYDKVKQVKKFAVQKGSSIWKERPYSQKAGQPDPTTLYKYMIELELEDGQFVQELR